VERERLGTTESAAGLAIPHGRMAEATDIRASASGWKTASITKRWTISRGLVFLLLAPEKAGADHLKARARALACMREGDLRECAVPKTVEACTPLLKSEERRRFSAALKGAGPFVPLSFVARSLMGFYAQSILLLLVTQFLAILFSRETLLTNDLLTGACRASGNCRPGGHRPDRVHHLHAEITCRNTHSRCCCRHLRL